MGDFEGKYRVITYLPIRNLRVFVKFSNFDKILYYWTQVEKKDLVLEVQVEKKDLVLEVQVRKKDLVLEVQVGKKDLVQDERLVREQEQD